MWRAALATLATLPRWTLVSADPWEGDIAAAALPLFGREAVGVRIRVSLDEEGLTSVEVLSSPHAGWWEPGGGERRSARFLHALRRRVAVEPRDQR